MGLRLSPEKTLITHIDKGLDFRRLARAVRRFPLAGTCGIDHTRAQ